MCAGAAWILLNNANNENEKSEVKTEWRRKKFSPRMNKIINAIDILIICLSIMADIAVMLWLVDVNFGLFEDFSFFLECLQDVYLLVICIATLGAGLGIAPAGITFLVLRAFFDDFVTEEVVVK